MKQACVILLFLAMTSCNYFDVKKKSSEAILNEELQTFNWSEVDVYPTFSSCDSSASKESLKQCFQNTLTGFITNNLQEESIVVTQDIDDIIIMKFQISEKGILILLDVKVDSITRQEIPNINELLTKSLDLLPKIYPAVKRGQQVKIEFNLPVIIQVN